MEHPGTEGATRKRNGHIQAKAPTIGLDQPGRLRVCHLLCLFSVSHSTLYDGIKTGRYPKPDGRDGRMPWWHTDTVRLALQH
jgi:hypothetical protein